MEIRHLLWLLVVVVSFEERFCLFVVFQGKHLTSVPGNISPAVWQIFLNINDITTIRQVDFNDKYPKLFDLVINDNRITTIESGCFKGTVLKMLILRANELTTFPDLLEVSHTLTILDLSSNKITTIEVDKLTYLTKLTTLYLSDNRLSTFPDIRHVMPSLADLWLMKNPLDCCCSNVWMKQVENGLSITLGNCAHPPGWVHKPYSWITEDMLLRQPCQEVSATAPLLCGSAIASSTSVSETTTAPSTPDATEPPASTDHSQYRGAYFVHDPYKYKAVSGLIFTHSFIGKIACANECVLQARCTSFHVDSELCYLHRNDRNNDETYTIKKLWP
ncbi:hypothetical protein CAPTEDRAFT_209392 [Capitella teleta]|uniref:Apple domain-containing protein n=1 Tax=Capitella teleta TaxID=283909 RepID=R7V5P4_CAPTE|nr:hypothetical protein CAPTEDRAFT_209392 [Capitella teleta]|eukprot:ELU11105.1 hypothetical protein CAPTEDRAFT_209392 [Capitella teleta]